MTGRHEQAALERLRAAAKVITAGPAAADAEADLWMAHDLLGGLRAAAALLLAAEAIEEQAKQCATTLRAAMAQVMADTGATEVRLPHHTVALVEPKPRPFVSDASALPAEFLIQPPPKPDMAAITKAMRAGPVAGVSMSNGQPHIRISSRKDTAA